MRKTDRKKQRGWEKENGLCERAKSDFLYDILKMNLIGGEASGHRPYTMRWKQFPCCESKRSEIEWPLATKKPTPKKTPEDPKLFIFKAKVITRPRRRRRSWNKVGKKKQYTLQMARSATHAVVITMQTLVNWKKSGRDWSDTSFVMILDLISREKQIRSSPYFKNIQEAFIPNYLEFGL